MATTPLTDQQPADTRILDLIQAEHDNEPGHFRANGDMHAPRLLAIAQALRAELEQVRLQAAAVLALPYMDKNDSMDPAQYDYAEAYNDGVEAAKRAVVVTWPTTAAPAVSPSA